MHYISVGYFRVTVCLTDSDYEPESESEEFKIPDDVLKSIYEEPDNSNDELSEYDRLVKRVYNDMHKYIDVLDDHTRLGIKTRGILHSKIQNDIEDVFDTRNADLIRQLHNTLNDIYNNLPADVKSSEDDIKNRFIDMLKYYIDDTDHMT
jgi:hypothetical protein